MSQITPARGMGTGRPLGKRTLLGKQLATSHTARENPGQNINRYTHGHSPGQEYVDGDASVVLQQAALGPLLHRRPAVEDALFDLERPELGDVVLLQVFGGYGRRERVDRGGGTVWHELGDELG